MDLLHRSLPGTKSKSIDFDIILTELWSVNECYEVSCGPNNVNVQIMFEKNAILTIQLNDILHHVAGLLYDLK